MNTSSSSAPRFAAALSQEANSAKAVSDVVTRALAALDAAPDLAVAFVSHHHGPNFGELAAALATGTRARVLIGCTGESIVGGDREIHQLDEVEPGTNADPANLGDHRLAWQAG